VSEEHKHEGKPSGKKEDWQLLKELRAQRQATATHWETKREEMRQGRKDSLQEALSVSAKAMKALNDAKEAVKAKAKAAYDKVAAESEAIRLHALEAADRVHHEACSKAKEIMDVEYKVASEDMQRAAKPINDKHRLDLEGIEDDYKKEMQNIDEAARKELKPVDAAILELEAREKERQAEIQKKTAEAKAKAEAKAEVAPAAEG
jgi:hypothetical protein